MDEVHVRMSKLEEKCYYNRQESISMYNWTWAEETFAHRVGQKLLSIEKRN